MKQVTAILVSLNNLEDVKKTIESLILKSKFEITVIVVDSSGDEEIKDYISAQRASKLKIKYFWMEPSGIYPAMNLGLNACLDNSFVWFLNPGDILIDFNALVTLIENIEKNRKLWGFCQAIYDTSDKSAFPYEAENINALKVMTGTIPISHQAVIAHTKFLKDLGGFNSVYKIAADLELITRMSNISIPIFVKEVLVRIDTTGISHKHLAKLYSENFRMARALKLETLVETCTRLLTILVFKLWNSNRLRGNR